jgi:hypothetical protein
LIFNGVGDFVNKAQQIGADNAGPRYPRLINGALVALSTILTLFVFEGALRLIFHARKIDLRTYQPSFIYGVSAADPHRFSSHPFLPWAPRPFDSRKLTFFRPAINQTVVCDYTNNAFGFRTAERAFTKPPHTKRIVVLGGSTTFDGPSNQQTWPALLEEKLNRAYEQSGYRIEVFNMGVDMASSPTSLINLAFLGTQFQPDLVISYDGVNDTVFLCGFEGIAPDYRNAMDKYDDDFRSLQSRLPKWAFQSYLVTVFSLKYDRLFSKKPDVVSQVHTSKLSKLRRSVNPIEGVQYFERNLKLMRGISTEYGAKFLAATGHWLTPSPQVEQLNAELRSFFAREQIDYLDLDRALEHNDLSIHVDPVHWTLKGLDQVAEQWKSQIIAKDMLKLNQAP